MPIQLVDLCTAEYSTFALIDSSTIFVDQTTNSSTFDYFQASDKIEIPFLFADLYTLVYPASNDFDLSDKCATIELKFFDDVATMNDVFALTTTVFSPAVAFSSPDAESFNIV